MADEGEIGGGACIARYACNSIAILWAKQAGGGSKGSLIRAQKPRSKRVSPRARAECIQRNRLAWPHRRRGLASGGVRYADARSNVGRRFRSVTRLRLEWYGEVFLLLQQRSKHPREMVITPKASTSRLIGGLPQGADAVIQKNTKGAFG